MSPKWQILPTYLLSCSEIGWKGHAQRPGGCWGASLSRQTWVRSKATAPAGVCSFLSQREDDMSSWELQGLSWREWGNRTQWGPTSFVNCLPWLILRMVHSIPQKWNKLTFFVLWAKLCHSKFICWYWNPLHLWIWLCLEAGLKGY